MKFAQYVAPYNMPVNAAYLQCNDALCAASDAGEGFSLVPSQTADGRVLPAETHEGSGIAYRFTEHPVPSPSVDQRVKAFKDFELRKAFVAQLAKNLGIKEDASGALVLQGHSNAAEFYNRLEQFDNLDQ